MAGIDPSGGSGPPNWQGVGYLIVVTLISIGAEWLRRLLPPPRENRRRDDDDDDPRRVERRIVRVKRADERRRRWAGEQNEGDEDNWEV